VEIERVLSAWNNRIRMEFNLGRLRISSVVDSYFSHLKLTSSFFFFFLQEYLRSDLIGKLGFLSSFSLF
jgi:hypothetical protein